MADTKTQPTILVKKADGTSERISLAEFKLRKQSKLVSSQKPVAQAVSEVQSSNIKSFDKTQDKVQLSARRVIPLVEEVEKTVTKPQIRRAIPLVEETEMVKPTVPVVRGESHVTNTTPVAHVFVQKADDHRSLLDDDGDEIKAITQKNNASHAPITSVSFSSSVVIPKDLEARTTSLILSWKKGIRDRHQFLDYAVRGVADGGLGLTPVNAEKLFSEISGNAELKAPVTPSRLASRPQAPAPISQKKPQMQQIPNPTTLIREIAPTHEASRVMGPAEEAAAFTLEDFRRLSRDPKVAGSMLLAKFSGWKDESYLLYLQVRDSWRSSPLFRMYIDTTVAAIEKNVAILAELQGSGFRYEEYLAITEVNRKLGMMD